MTSTDNMLLDLPTVDMTIGPTWASMIITALQRIDAHDHSEDEGVLVTPAGLLINDTLDLLGKKLANALSVALSQVGAAALTAKGSVQNVGGNLWWVNSSGVAVQLTTGSSIISSGSGVLTTSIPASYPYAVLAGDAQSVLIADTTAARQFLLPAASNAMFFMIKDGAQAAQTHNITVTPDGSDTIDGLNSDYIVDANNACVGFISDGASKWYVV